MCTQPSVNDKPSDLTMIGALRFRLNLAALCSYCNRSRTIQVIVHS